MYEFDEQRWDRQSVEVGNETNPIDGWLIQKGGTNPRDGRRDRERIYLQIGTGQWCTSKYATRFPTKSAATAYAHKFGFSVGQTAEIVRHRFGSWHRRSE